MDIDYQNNIIKSFNQFEKRTANNLDSPNEFHQSFSNSDCDNEHRNLMIAEDEDSSKMDNENLQKNKPLLTRHSDVIESNETFPITNSFLQPQNNTEHLFSGPVVGHRDKLQETNPNLGTHGLMKVSTNLEGSQLYSGSQDRRKRGRPRKLFFVEQDTNREKRARGRPRKTEIEDKPIKEKKSVGRPRIYFNVEPKEKRPRGRPRVNFTLIKKPSNESGEKRPRGRPRKYSIDVVKEKRPRGRPRSNLRLDAPKSTNKRGRPPKRLVGDSDWRPTMTLATKQIKEELSSVGSNDEDADEDDENARDSDPPFMAREQNTVKSTDITGGPQQLPRKRGRPKKVLNLIKYSKLDDTSSVEEGNTLSSSVSNADTVDGIM